MKFISIILWVSLGELVVFFFLGGGGGGGGAGGGGLQKRAN
jgi:hypothetical protein